MKRYLAILLAILTVGLVIAPATAQAEPYRPYGYHPRHRHHHFHKRYMPGHYVWRHHHRIWVPGVYVRVY